MNAKVLELAKGTVAARRAAAPSPQAARKPPRRRRVRPNDVALAPTAMASEERTRMIAEAAYFRAEQRGFEGGSALQDWLDAEAEIDALLRAC